jgi:hypothetical protein
MKDYVNRFKKYFHFYILFPALPLHNTCITLHLKAELSRIKQKRYSVKAGQKYVCE